MTKTEQELTRIQGAKSALRDAILAKGGTLNEDARIDEYAPAVHSLPSGSGQAEAIPPIKIYGNLRNNNGQGGSGGFWGFIDMEVCPPIDTSGLINAYGLFYRCRSLSALPESLDLGRATSIDFLISESGIGSANIVAPVATSAIKLAYNCPNLTSLTIDLPSCTNASDLVMSCPKLTNIEAKLPECTNVGNMLSNCPKTSSIKISELKCSLSLLGTAVTIESVQYIVEHAQEAMEGAILTLPSSIERSLPEETMEMALEKGFEVAFR